MGNPYGSCQQFQVSCKPLGVLVQCPFSPDSALSKASLSTDTLPGSFSGPVDHSFSTESKLHSANTMTSEVISCYGLSVNEGDMSPKS